MMDPAELRYAVVDVLGWSPEAFADVMGVPPKTVSFWLSGEAAMPERVKIYVSTAAYVKAVVTEPTLNLFHDEKRRDE